jgi:osmotically-inducible protein OsmY
MFSRQNEPEIRYESSTSFFALLGALGAGAALMYFLDPDNGRRRRALVRDQVVHGRAVMQDMTESAVHNAANHTRGAIARIQGRIASRGDEAADDSVLEERVRAAMGHVIGDPQAIEIRVHDGCVMLKGPAQPHEIGELVACAERVRGVREVDNRLSISNPS